MLLYAALMFFLVGGVAALLGFSGIAAGVIGISKMIFVACLFLGGISLLFVLLQRRRAENMRGA